MAQMETSVELDIRQAAERFYSAVGRMFVGDLAPMSDIWSHADDVTLLGPFAGRQEGWQQVWTQMQLESRRGMAGEVEAADLIIREAGDWAYAVCIERGRNMTVNGRPVNVEHRATNIFRREGGQWKLAHHHSDLNPALQEAVREPMEEEFELPLD